MANIKSAEKRARQTIKRRARNVAGRSKLRTAIKGVVNAVEAGDITIVGEVTPTAAELLVAAVG